MRIRSCFLSLVAVCALAGCEEPIVPSDPANAALYQACHKDNDSKSCVALGENYEHGKRVGWKPQRAIELYEKACTAGYADGCRHAGFFWEKNHAVLQPDHARAAKHLRKACDAGLMDTCVELGSLYHNGPLPRNHKRAVSLYQRACDHGTGEACIRLGLMYRTGDGVKSNQKKAAALFLRACDKDIGRACLSLGEHYFLAWGVPEDVKTGRRFLQKACALNDTLACNALYGAEPAGGGTVKATTRAWKQMIAAPSVQTLLNVRTNDELIQRLTRFRDAYASIDCRGADPELCEYVEAWKTVATRMIDVCERDERSKRTASNIETLGGMLGALFEKGKSGERHEDTLDRGMEKGSRKGKMIAEIMGLTGGNRAEDDAHALGRQARQLTDYQDALALRLESVYHVFLPPPSNKKKA